jgi:hypothetical protein
MRNDSAERRLLVPAYIHPGAEPGAWQALLTAADTLAGVILNPYNGPDTARHGVWAEVSDQLRAAGVPVLGYVDTAYGRRSHREVTEDVERHCEWYGVDGVFLDQVAEAAAALPHYRRLTVAARAFDLGTVVLNPGVHPDPGYAEISDLLVTFEGPWEAYRELRVPEWTSSHPPQRFCHLVHATPVEHCAHVGETARFRHAGVYYATPGSVPNPWNVLMPHLEQRE